MTQNPIDNETAAATTLNTTGVQAQGQPQTEAQAQAPTLIKILPRPRQTTTDAPVLAEVPVGTVMPEYADHHTARALFGLSRSYLYLLAAEGSIRTVNVLRPGATKGRRLFDCASIRELMQASAINAEAAEAA